MHTTRSVSSVSSGLPEAIACAVLLLLATNIIPFYFKTLFVEETGNIKIAPFFGFVVAIGLLWGKNWARPAGMLLSAFVVVVSVISVATQAYKPGYLIVSLLSLGALGLLFFSERLKRYLA
jgi:hypothetical protein